MHSCSRLVQLGQRLHGAAPLPVRRRLPARHHEALLHAPFPIRREHLRDLRVIFERRLHRASLQNKMERIFFIEIEIDREAELQLLRFLREKTGGHDVFENIARIADGRLRGRREVEPAHPAEAIASRKEAHSWGEKPTASS